MLSVPLVLHSCSSTHSVRFPVNLLDYSGFAKFFLYLFTLRKLSRQIYLSKSYGMLNTNCNLYFQTVSTPHTKMAKANLLPPPADVELGYFLQAALQSAYLCLLHRG